MLQRFALYVILGVIIFIILYIIFWNIAWNMVESDMIQALESTTYAASYEGMVATLNSNMTYVLVKWYWLFNLPPGPPDWFREFLLKPI